MANFVTVSYGLVTRESSTNGEKPALTVSDDPWLEVSGMNPRPVIGDHYDGTDFTLDHTALTSAQGAKLASLRDLCAAHIKYLGFTGWFTEDTPAVYWVYATEAKDQSNIHAAAAAARLHDGETIEQWSARLWCAEAQDSTARVVDGTNWDRRDHSASQISQIALRLHKHVEDAQDELQVDSVAVLAATTINDVNAVTWQAPGS